MGKGPAIVSVLTAGGGGDGGMVDLSKAVFKIALFIGIAIFFYSPWLNQPVPGDTWDKEPATGWEKGDWTWSAIDCIYFAMVTMTTVGYGDMPSLRQEMRLLTMVFGFVGVVVVSGGITVIADWFSERGRLKFIAKQQELLAEAKKIVKMAPDESNEGSEADAAEEEEKDADIVAKLADDAKELAALQDIVTMREGVEKLAAELEALRDKLRERDEDEKDEKDEKDEVNENEDKIAARNEVYREDIYRVAGVPQTNGDPSTWLSLAPMSPSDVVMVEKPGPVAKEEVDVAQTNGDPTTPLSKLKVESAGPTPRANLNDRNNGEDVLTAAAAAAAVISVDGTPVTRPKPTFYPTTPENKVVPLPLEANGEDSPDKNGDAAAKDTGNDSGEGSDEPSLTWKETFVQKCVDIRETFRWHNIKNVILPEMLKVLKALKGVGVFILLCIVLGEIENAQFDCSFMQGWGCGFGDPPGNCETFKNEHPNCWTWVDELYYAVITLVTIGYGDVSPQSAPGKVLASFLVVMGVLTLTTLVNEFMQIAQAKRLGAEKTLRERLLELKEVIEQDDDGTVSPEEYIIHNLLKMQKVDQETLDLLNDQFSVLDADGSGELDGDDIEMLTALCDKADEEARAEGKPPARSPPKLPPPGRGGGGIIGGGVGIVNRR